VSKALVEVAGRPMVAWSLLALDVSSRVDAAVITARAGDEDALKRLARDTATSLRVTVTQGGASRSESVAAGVRTVDADVVVVHDAARPLVTPELVDRCVERLERWGCDAVVAAARAVDTMKEADAGGRVLATLERASLWGVQTPQAFRTASLRGAFERTEVARAYDDAQLVEAAGGDVRVIEAPRSNFKVTTPTDLEVAALLLMRRAATA
jgi:2-C-methyl-D-erythritol 4-phosphate cytidylyltransferase